ncbi:MAG: HAMP domain-containing sensor histidine kinase [Pseudoxanthomonas sp.]|nr:HAMP domain-containing sensor histidine kinase [Pseudoxanthomonas sp.]
MPEPARPRRRLRRRILLAFTGFTVLLALAFGFFAAVLVYAVEDAMLAGLIEDEARWLQAEHARRGAWPAPRVPFIARHDDPSGFPADLAGAWQAEPWRTEFRGGEGRHYHLMALQADGRPAGWLVAEVSGQLAVRPMRGKLLRLLGGVGGSAVVLALALGWLLARRTSAPLVRLADQVAALSPDALPERLGGHWPDDEVGVLARGLDGLLGRLQRFVERERAFTRDASHELRTPLAVIRSAAERLSAQPGLDDAARRRLDDLRRSAAQLEGTVASLLALARELPVDPEPAAPVALLPMLERAVVDQAPLAGDRPVTVRIEVGADARAFLPGDVLAILLGNLVGNALAHTPAGEVRIDLDDGHLRIDNPGWPLDEAVGAPGQAGVRRPGSPGQGFGLAIVARLCRRHGIGLAIETLESGVVRTRLALAPAVTVAGSPGRDPAA